MAFNVHLNSDYAHLDRNYVHRNIELRDPEGVEGDPTGVLFVLLGVETSSCDPVL